jgi:hypothetical protein
MEKICGFKPILEHLNKSRSTPLEKAIFFQLLARIAHNKSDDNIRKLLTDTFPEVDAESLEPGEALTLYDSLLS